MTEIKLGDTVQSIYSGFKGVATSKSEFINGCIQFGVTAKVEKENKIPEEVDIDAGSLKIIKKGPRHKEEEKEESNGGPNRRTHKMSGF